MALPFDPLREKPHHSKKELDALFKGPLVVLQRLFKENPSRYRELRAEYMQHGGIDAPGYRDETNKRSVGPQPRTFSDSEIVARAEFSEAEVRRYYTQSGQDANRDNLGTLLKQDPEKAARLKVAAISYGILPSSAANPPQRPVAKPAQPATPADDRVVISDDLAAKANLPVGLRVTQDQLNKIMHAVADVELAKKNSGEGGSSSGSGQAAA
jgi:hypothetical protein